MSRKDYIAIAEVFARRSHMHPTSRESIEVAQEIASVFAADNPRFDRGRFIRACFPNLAEVPA